MQIAKLVTSVTATAALAAAILGGISPAAHADAAPQDAQTQKMVTAIEAKLTTQGIAVDTQAALIGKFLRGGQFDADTGKVAPASEATRTENGATITRYVYPDGSVAQASMQTPREVTPGGASTQDIYSCQVTVTADVHEYKNCVVGWNAATWSMEYHADFGYYQFGSWVSSIRGVNVEGAGDFSNIQANVIVSTCNSSCTSWGQGQAIQKIAIAGVGSSRTIGTKISVNNTDKKGGRSSSFG